MGRLLLSIFDLQTMKQRDETTRPLTRRMQEDLLVQLRALRLFPSNRRYKTSIQTRLRLQLETVVLQRTQDYQALRVFNWEALGPKCSSVDSKWSLWNFKKSADALADIEARSDICNDISRSSGSGTILRKLYYADCLLAARASHYMYWQLRPRLLRWN